MAPELEALLDPTGRTPGTEGANLAARRGSLRGRSVGLLDNTKPNSGVLLDRLGLLLQQRHGAGELKTYAKSSFAVPADDRLLSRIAAECDVALAGVGD